MNNILKSTCLSTMCALAAIANAAPPSLNDANGAQACEPDSGFYLKFTGAAMLPSETGLGSFTDSWQYADADGGVTALSKPSKATYKFAAAGLAGYNVPSSATFVEAEYFYLSNSQHNYNDTSDNPVSFGSAFFNVALPITPGVPFVSDAYLKYKVNQVDVRAGYNFTSSKKNLEIFPSAGVRWSDLTHSLTFLVGNVKTSYWGVGPTFAVDALYKIYKGFKFSTHFDANLLIGNVEASSFLNFGALLRYKSPSTSRIVSAFGAKLGLSYGHVFSNQMSLQIEAGYQAATYIGAFDILTAITPISFTPPQIQRIASINSDNFSFAGPYGSIGFLF